MGRPRSVWLVTGRCHDQIGLDDCVVGEDDIERGEQHLDVIRRGGMKNQVQTR